MNLSKSNIDTAALEADSSSELKFIRAEHYYKPGKDVLKYLRFHINRFEPSTILMAKERSGLDFLAPGQPHIVNLQRINDIRHMNKFFEKVNEKLEMGGKFISYVETSFERKKRILNKFPKIISYPYYTLDYILKRVFPKWSVTKRIYFALTKGRNRVLSVAETLGRLVSCGFEILEYKEINNNLYFVTRKVKEPSYDMRPSYGPLIRMRRVGKNGKIIRVYKFRTMHPYAEYLQEYVYKKYNLKEGGKFENDFRITTAGKLFRKIWVDELPMIINLMRGDLKLVGVRPLSLHYFNLYDDELKEKRSKHKPGLVPPYYADMPKTLDEIIESEKKYLDSFERAPIRTDIKYFIKAFQNILFKKARSA
ncbi:MAG: sugar transferase [Bacteroidetes bacterium]|nr:sugar transferase [Bacteroidota bacterium]